MTRLITHTTRVCSSSLTSHRTGRGLVLLQPSNEATTESLQARSLSLQGWGLIDLPLRASNEGSPRPRVARAQKIISLHPLLSCPVLSCPGAKNRYRCQSFCLPILLSVPRQSRRILSLCLIQISVLTIREKTKNSCLCSFTIATTGKHPKAASAPPDE
jgi:hypothetical protein